MTQATINQILPKLIKAGFESYGSFNEGLQHEIFTCTKGKYSGEVVDVYYNYKTGLIHSIEYTCQFKNQIPTFRIVI